jgi:hypothetical protein
LLKVEAFRRDVIAVARLGCITGTKVAKGSGISSEPGRSGSVEPMSTTVSGLGNVLGERRPVETLLGSKHQVCVATTMPTHATVLAWTMWIS